MPKNTAPENEADLGYIVERFDLDSGYTVHLWRPESELSDSLWKAPVKELKGKAGGEEGEGVEEGRTVVCDHPRVFLASGGSLYLGMNSGLVEKVDLKDGSITRFGPRNHLNRGTETPATIRHLVHHDGKVYDASYGGLFETETGAEVDDCMIGSAETYDGMLLIVPHGLNPKRLEGRDYTSPRISESDGRRVTTYSPGLFKFNDSVRESKAGDLIDAMTKKTVMRQVEPFDGSGCAPGHHAIFDGKVYMRHGDYPYEKITIRDFANGRVIGQHLPDVTTDDFILHNGTVYDLRTCWTHEDSDRDRYMRLMPSDKDTSAAESIFEVPFDEDVTGMVSAGDNGVLISLFDENKSKSRIVSHLNPDRSLMEYDGKLFLTAI